MDDSKYSTWACDMQMPNISKVNEVHMRWMGGKLLLLRDIFYFYAIYTSSLVLTDYRVTFDRLYTQAMYTS